MKADTYCIKTPDNPNVLIIENQGEFDIELDKVIIIGGENDDDPWAMYRVEDIVEADKMVLATALGEPYVVEHNPNDDEYPWRVIKLQKSVEEPQSDWKQVFCGTLADASAEVVRLVKEAK
jgi:hypothetical protein